MKWQQKYSLVCVAIFGAFICGCRSQYRETVTIDHGDGKPPTRVTKTVTETVQVERPVPVYRIEKTIQHNTQTRTSDGSAATPLHTATVTQPAAGAVITDPGAAPK